MLALQCCLNSGIVRGDSFAAVSGTDLRNFSLSRTVMFRSTGGENDELIGRAWSLISLDRMTIVTKHVEVDHDQRSDRTTPARQSICRLSSAEDHAIVRD